VRRGGDDADARLDVLSRHRERTAEVGRAVVDPRQQMAVEVDHGPLMIARAAARRGAPRCRAAPSARYLTNSRTRL